MVLEFTDWKFLDSSLSDTNLKFRSCQPEDMDRLLEMVHDFTKRYDKVGWYDQYSFKRNIAYTKDIVVSTKNEIIIAAGITYTPSADIISDLPWARRIGDDVGGLTCICISSTRDLEPVMIGLLDISVRKLQDLGMRKMYVDAIGAEAGLLESLD
ncbi:hypothetical protein F5884DRAFT_255249 [Xylogone sp. PMI_703]|nr:hypothetical protein F5884DRAFT_255249 [Xylogone sp. PMI_703]